uniref:Variant surface glycoprotein 1125.260 n=1 Tax=Trypanosoma brucei TaxID=5691 RepID=M4TDI3_9TRYP|nr:variant surface glycoprotein 562 [Trypanosoma brucei]APD73096.1 variant surface glycoprotein 1125.260 [Trypanosoma brucei]
MTAVLLTVEAVVLVTAMVGAATETSIEAVSSPCHEVQYLEKLISHFEGKLSAARSRAAELSADYSLLTLAGLCTEDTQKAAVYIALSGETKEAEMQQEAAIATGEGSITELVKTLKARVSQTKVLIHAETDALDTQVATAATKTETFLSTGTDEHCTIPTSRGTATADSCNEKAGSGTHIDKAVVELQQIENIKLLKDERFLTPEYELIVAAQGNAGSGGPHTSYKKGACATSADSGKNLRSLTVALGVKSITRKKGEEEAPAKQSLFKGIDATSGCVDAAQDAKSHLTTQKKVANAICRHRGADIKLYERPLLKSKTKLAAEDNMRALSQLLTKGKVNTKEEATSQTEAVKALLPAGESTLSADLVDPLENEEITYEKDNNPVKTTIKSANKAGKFATTLAFCFGRQQRRKSAITASKGVSDTRTTEKCKDTEKDKCTADKDCEYSEGKCKLKEGVKVEGNDKKTANTTGSNSFTIKVPLLLAVLLL